VTAPLFHPNFWGVTVAPEGRVGVMPPARAEALSYSAVKLFSKYSSLWHCDHGAWTSQTDGQSDDILWHNCALRSIAR